MNNPGTTVCVHWYGKLLQGTVVNDNDLMGMVAVRIPLMGGHPVALFTPGHVYDTADEAKIAKSVPEIEESVPNYSENVPRVSETSMCDAFKESHWDNEHNHLRTDSLEEFYQLWRTAVAAKNVFTVAPAYPPTVSVDPGSPDGDRSSIIVTDVATGTIVPYAAVSQQPQPLIKTHDQVVPIKLSKKQLRSTARIQYADSIQTSIFD